jgi:ESCRT-II complex subunit VPS36
MSEYPTEILKSTVLSTAGRPIFEDGEVEIKVIGNVSIYLAKHNKESHGLFTCTLVLTNWRLLLLLNNNGNMKGLYLDLIIINNVEDNYKYFGKSSRLFINITSIDKQIGCKFEDSNIKEDFIEIINKVLLKKSWENKPKSKMIDQEKKNIFSISNAGVGGLIRKQQRELKSVDNITKEAIIDMDSLMNVAKEVVEIVQRYASVASEERGDGSDTSSDAGERSEMDEILQNIGIVSPITRYSAGRLYHQQLSRQLADLFLTQDRLVKMGGMVTLTDAYCIFNRARGTELVSPDDLLAAANLIDSLRVGIKIRTFPSGVMMLQLDAMNEESMFEQLVEIYENEKDIEIKKTGLHAAIIAQYLKLPVVVAKEQLILAESKEILCRDESIHGLSFFPNKFKTYF